MEDLKIIVVGGMIGVGKTSLIHNLCTELKKEKNKVSVVYEIWEDCEDNVFNYKNTYDEFMDTIIALYYENLEKLNASAEGSDEHMFRLHKLLTHQIHFLSTRTSKVFAAINEAVKNKNDYLILDRSLYEDIVFTSLNLKKYKNLWSSYYKIWEYWESKFNDIVTGHNTQHFILDASIETILKRIQKRGRDYEQGEDVYKYFEVLNEQYVEQIITEFNKKNVTNYSLIDTEDYNSSQLARKIFTHYL